jgi:hypothetical protein
MKVAGTAGVRVLRERRYRGPGGDGLEMVVWTGLERPTRALMRTRGFSRCGRSGREFGSGNLLLKPTTLVPRGVGSSMEDAESREHRGRGIAVRRRVVGSDFRGRRSS